MALTPKQTLILWALLTKPDHGALQKDIKPALDKKDRDALHSAGVIVTEKRGRALWLEVSEKGWSWAGDHLADALPSRSTEGAAILQAWLARLKLFMSARGFALADILAPRAEVKGDDDIPARVRAAYLDSTGGAFNALVPLGDLRARLDGVDSAALDEALSAMHLAGEATLSGIDNPRDITAATREAAIEFKGLKMHQLRIAR
jgi:hypothetical protein